MKAKYSGVKEDKWTNSRTGEMGTSYYLDVIDENGSHRMRVPQELAQTVKRLNLKPMQDVQLVVGWLAGQNGSEWLGLTSIQPTQLKA